MLGVRKTAQPGGQCGDAGKGEWWETRSELWQVVGQRERQRRKEGHHQFLTALQLVTDG